MSNQALQTLPSRYSCFQNMLGRLSNPPSACIATCHKASISVQTPAEHLARSRALINVVRRKPQAVHLILSPGHALLDVLVVFGNHHQVIDILTMHYLIGEFF